jgi:hypothetical protein
MLLLYAIACTHTLLDILPLCNCSLLRLLAHLPLPFSCSRSLPLLLLVTLSSLARACRFTSACHRSSLRLSLHSSLTTSPTLSGMHDSVGGQPTVALDVNFSKIAEACGYNYMVIPLHLSE